MAMAVVAAARDAEKALGAMSAMRGIQLVRVRVN
jgi:hypothetical protein